MTETSEYRLHLSHTVSLIIPSALGFPPWYPDPENGVVIWAGSIEQFFADNEFDDVERDAIHAELSVNGYYRGGGGATAAFELYDRLLPKPAPGTAKIAKGSRP